MSRVCRSVNVDAVGDDVLERLVVRGVVGRVVDVAQHAVGDREPHLRAVVLRAVPTQSLRARSKCDIAPGPSVAGAAPADAGPNASATVATAALKSTRSFISSSSRPTVFVVSGDSVLDRIKVVPVYERAEAKSKRRPDHRLRPDRRHAEVPDHVRREVAGGSRPATAGSAPRSLPERDNEHRGLACRPSAPKRATNTARPSRSAAIAATHDRDHREVQLRPLADRLVASDRRRVRRVLRGTGRGRSRRIRRARAPPPSRVGSSGRSGRGRRRRRARSSPPSDSA